MARFVRPDIGHRLHRASDIAIKSGASNRSVIAIWGFGSYFRTGPFLDVDLLVCLSSVNSKIIIDAIEVKRVLETRFSKIGLLADILVFRPKEVKEKPLREMSKLIPLYSKGCAISTAFRHLGL